MALDESRSPRTRQPPLSNPRKTPFIFVTFIVTCSLLLVQQYQDAVPIDQILLPINRDLPSSTVIKDTSSSPLSQSPPLRNHTEGTKKFNSDVPPIVSRVPSSQIEEFSELTNVSDNNPSLLKLQKELALAKAQTRLVQLRKLSSVDYFSCCGLGHRLSKNTDAYYVSKLLHFGLRIHWGFCDRTEVSQYLFGPQPEEQLRNVTSTATTVRLNNEVSGFKKLIREGNTTACKCSHAKFELDVEYYTSLRNRFRFRKRVDAFRDDMKFANHTVFGMHIRAGNNETGDFNKKNRTITNLDDWIERITGHVRKLAETINAPPYLLYLATDTASLISKFRLILHDTMRVIELPQTRPKEGTGVLFGSVGDVQTTGRDTCLAGWTDAMMDLILLSYTDVVIAARPSSFVQGMPMILSLGAYTQEKRKQYCEVSFNASAIQCFSNLMQWCCDGVGSFVYGNMNQRYDYIRVPHSVHEQEWVFLNRTGQWCQPGPRIKSQCLPYDWPKQKRFESQQEELFE